MEKQDNGIRTRVEELMKSGTKLAAIHETLKKEGFKSRDGKPLAKGSVAYYTRPKTPKKQKRVIGSSNSNNPVVTAIVTLFASLSKEDRVKVAFETFLA